jgi:hypothetical protein
VRLLTELYIEALLADEALADEVLHLWIVARKYLARIRKAAVP